MTHHYTPPAVAFSAPLQVRWSDQDLNGHVNNARVVTLMEEARLQAARSWTEGIEAHADLPRVVRSMSVDFRRALYYGPRLTAAVWVTRLGTTSFTIRHELVQEDTLCVVCEAVIVLLDPATGKPTAVPAALRAALEKALPTT